MRTLKVKDVDYDLLNSVKIELQKGTSAHVYYHDAFSHLVQKLRGDGK